MSSSKLLATRRIRRSKQKSRKSAPPSKESITKPCVAKQDVVVNIADLLRGSKPSTKCDAATKFLNHGYDECAILPYTKSIKLYEFSHVLMHPNKNVEHRFLVTCFSQLHQCRQADDVEREEEILTHAAKIVEALYSQQTYEEKEAMITTFIDQYLCASKSELTHCKPRNILQAYFYVWDEGDAPQTHILEPSSIEVSYDHTAWDTFYTSLCVPANRIYFSDGMQFALGTRMTYILMLLNRQKTQLDWTTGTSKLVWLLYCWLANRLITKKTPRIHKE